MVARKGFVRPEQPEWRGPDSQPASVALRAAPVPPAAVWVDFAPNDLSGKIARSGVHNAEIQPGVGGDGKPSCISLAGAMCSRRERAFSTCQGHRTTALPSPCLDTLRTSARAHAVAPRARASPQPLRGTRPTGPSQWARHAPFDHGVRASHNHEKQAPEPGKPARPSGSGVPAAQESFLGCPLLHKRTYGPP
jgi:hypothetical protein